MPTTPPDATLTCTDALLNSSTASSYARSVGRVVDDVAARLAAVEQPWSGASRTELAALVEGVDLDAPIGTDSALRETADLYATHAVWFHDPAYAAHLNCPVAIPAVGAEAMLAAINTSVDTYDQSTVATLMERRLVGWTTERIGFTGGDGVFTSGGTQSNLHALLAARESALTGPDGTRLRGVARHGLQERLRILTTSSSHFSVAKSAMILGLSDDAVVTVGADADGRMDPGALAEALATTARVGDVVMAVVATAGTTDRGCIDPIATIADLCDATDAWLHVDAAYGGGLLVSAARRHCLDGIERARSVTVDFHKTFFQPVSASAVLVRDPADLSRTAWHADYLNPVPEAGAADVEINQVDRSLQTTRRFDALKLWATLRAVGADGIGEMVDAVCDLAAAVHADLRDDPELHLVGRTDLSTVLFRYQPAGVTDAQADALVARVRRVLFDSGRASVARTVVEGRPCLKLTLLNPEVTLDDVRHVLGLVRGAAHGILAGQALADDHVPPCRDVHPHLDRYDTTEAAR